MTTEHRTVSNELSSVNSMLNSSRVRALRLGILASPRALLTPYAERPHPNCQNPLETRVATSLFIFWSGTGVHALFIRVRDWGGSDFRFM